MASEVTPRQRAEAVVDTVKAELPPIWLGGRQRMVLVDEITQALTTARWEALREAAERLGVGDSNGLLAAPCLWCGYNGEGYYQAGTHGQSCPWNTIGGCDERLDRLAREAQINFVASRN